MKMARRGGADPTPICRCRVLYLGSSVPQVTKDGLQGIQEPLRELYPAEGAVSARGIDSWLSVWSNGLLLENVDENQKKVTRFFPIESLHYCAAVRYVVVAGGGEGATVPRFLPLDSPFARNPNINHPPLFACIMRRTTGIKVLECHAFICKRETPANALVRCCFHAYADSMYARSLEGGGGGNGTTNSQYGSMYGGRATEERVIEIEDFSSAASEIIPASLGSSPTGDVPASPTSQDSPGDEISIYNGDENHKVWAGPPKSEAELIYSDYSSGTLRSARSTSSLYGTAGGRRPTRPRQMIMPSVAPPPPPPSEPEKEKKGKRLLKGKGRRDDDEMSRITNGGGVPMRPASLMNGANGGMRYANGSLPRHMNGHGSPPKGKGGKFPKGVIQGSSSLSDRKSKGMRGPPPFMMIQGPPLGPGQNPHGPPGPHSHPGPPGPPAAFHGPMVPPMGPMPPPHMMPIHGPPPHLQMMGPPGPPPPPPPHAMMPPPQVGPIGPYGPMMAPGPGRRPPSRVLEEPIYMPSSRPLSPTASYQPGHFPHEQYLMQQYATTGRPKHKKKKKSSSSSGGKKELDEDIYGRKGHLNERAFSYSIREEHRSRSYGSLAGIGEDSMSKKDREILQMVADLDLSGDELERVEARPGVYRPPHSDRLSASGTITSRLSRASRR